MTIKLTPELAKALVSVFQDMVLVTYPETIDEQLLVLHMIAIYKKLRAKWEGDPVKQYKIKLTKEEAFAYRIYWRDNDITATHGQYEVNMLMSHCIQIDQEIHSITRINTRKFLNQ